jgi:N-acyl-D-amino-acid deacylase
MGMPVPDAAVRDAVSRAIFRLETGAANYPKNRSCFSCHHQALPVMALAAAKERGFKVNDAVLAQQVKLTLETFKPKLKDVRNGSGIGGANTTAGYALQTLRVANHSRDDITDALIEFLLKKQKPDGSWEPTTNRPPSEGSFFTSSALAIQALEHYGSASDDELTKRLQSARDKGVQFIRAKKLETTEDHVFRLWGLVVAGADEKEIGQAKKDLLGRQLPNGGWSQLVSMSSDAYATGSAMVALRMAGLSPQEQAYRRGVRHLALSQDPCGSWIVQTRSKPIQQLFDNGDPGGKSQFISIAATGWAALALLEVFEKKSP